MTAQEKNAIKQHLAELDEWVEEQAYSQAEQEAADTIEALEKEVESLSSKLGTIYEALNAMESVWFNLYQSDCLTAEARESYKNMSIAITCARQLFKSQEAAQQALDTYSKLI